MAVSAAYMHLYRMIEEKRESSHFKVAKKRELHFFFAIVYFAFSLHEQKAFFGDGKTKNTFIVIFWHSGTQYNRQMSHSKNNRQMCIYVCL